MSRLGLSSAALATVVAAAIAVAATTSAGTEEPAARPSAASELTPRQLAGQRIVCGFSGTRAPQSLLNAVSAGEVGGVIYFEDNVRSRTQVARMSAAIQAAPRPAPIAAPVIVSIDQEGGLVKRLPGPPKSSAAEMGARGPGYARSQGAATGASLKGVGVNVDLAPVLDVARPGGFIAAQRRAFGSKPGRVGSVGSAFAAGLQSAGVAATAKHFPGLGSTDDNTDLRTATIPLKRGVLRRVDEAPYEAFAAAGGKLVMISSARYPALGTGRLPAVQSKALIQRELRGRLGYDGVTISDSLEAPGARAGSPPAKVATRAAAAGTDLLLYVHCDAAMRGARALRQGLASGKLPRTEFEESVDRILALRAGL
jgi:beta-N-acetylhexosaminidase